MGTNYYAGKPPCEHCGHSERGEHIGKSSAGWCFSLHVMPEDGIFDLSDWRERLERSGKRISNEYGETVTLEELENIITERASPRPFDGRDWHGYNGEEDFHRSNQSERGPNGLLRHRISTRCIRHGAGTWDCIVGEFS